MPCWGFALRTLQSLAGLWRFTPHHGSLISDEAEIQGAMADRPDTAARPRRASASQQFAAVLHKNLLLRLRGG